MYKYLFLSLLLLLSLSIYSMEKSTEATPLSLGSAIEWNYFGAPSNSTCDDPVSLFIQGIENLDIHQVHLALVLGAPINILLTTGETPLTYVIKKDRNDLFTFLLTWKDADNPTNSSDSTQLNSMKESPLECILLTGNEQMFKTLGEHRKVSFEISNVHNYTALHFAVLGGNPFIVDVVLKHSKNPNGQDKEGNTALHLAVFFLKDKKAQETIIHSLLRAGALKTLTNSEGKRPIDYVDPEDKTLQMLVAP